MKKIVCVLLLICVCFTFVACGNTEPETVIQYIEVPIETRMCCGTSSIEYAPLNRQYVAIICSNCGRQLGELPIAEREVIKEVPVEVPVEVIVEKEIVVEKEVTIEVIKEVEVPIELKDCKIITWEEVVELQKGDRIENVFIMGDSFVSKFTNELYPAANQTYWTSNAKDPECYSMTPVKLKMNYTRGSTVYTDSLLNDYYTWGNIGIISGTIEEIIWCEDSYGNRTVDIIFDDNNFELKTFIDFCPVTNVK